MLVKTLEELAVQDERTGRFGPLGFMTDAMMKPKMTGLINPMVKSSLTRC